MNFQSNQAKSEDRERGRQRTRAAGGRWRRVVLWIILVLVVLGTISRLMLPGFVRDYVNRTLDRSQLYAGKIGEINVNLLRGAYSIHDITVSKRTGVVPVPLFAGKRVDFSIQWDALWHRRLVGRVALIEPELNFVDADSDEETQTGAGGAWLQVIQDLFPFKINRAIVENGAIHFRAFGKDHPVDVYLSEVNGSIDNLGNIRAETKPMVSTVQFEALAMGEAKFEYKMTLDPFSYRPTFEMATRLLGLDLTKINNLARSYGHFDFEKGWLDLVIETKSTEGQVSGYVKPLFRNPRIFTLSEDIKDDNAIEIFWQALVGGVVSGFKNWPRDQFGTVIPFTGNGDGTNTDILATLGNLLRNAFVRAYLPKLEPGSESMGGLKFAPPDVSDPISSGGAL